MLLTLEVLLLFATFFKLALWGSLMLSAPVHFTLLITAQYLLLISSLFEKLQFIGSTTVKNDFFPNDPELARKVSKSSKLLCEQH